MFRTVEYTDNIYYSTKIQYVGCVQAEICRFYILTILQSSVKIDSPERSRKKNYKALEKPIIIQKNLERFLKNLEKNLKKFRKKSRGIQKNLGKNLEKNQIKNLEKNLEKDLDKNLEKSNFKFAIKNLLHYNY